MSAGCTVTGLPFSGTTTRVAWPFISATNLSAFGSMIGHERIDNDRVDRRERSDRRKG
jgi:hypothetical protein